MQKKPRPLSFNLFSGDALPMRLFSSNNTRGNEQAWLGLLAAIDAGDVLALENALRQTQGFLSTHNSRGTLHNRKLARAVYSRLADHPGYQNRASRRSFRKDSEDRSVFVSAPELLWQLGPHLAADLVAERARASRGGWSSPIGFWLHENGAMPDFMTEQGPRGTAQESPHWAPVMTMALHCMIDHHGRYLASLAAQRAKTGAVPFPVDNAASRWISNHLGSPINRQDQKAIDKNHMAVPQKRLWDACLSLSSFLSQKENWSEARWSEWTRHALLCAGSVGRAHQAREAAAMFWAHCPNARLPLSLDDNVDPRVLFDEHSISVFTDARLGEWIAHAPGAGRRPAIHSHEAVWAEPANHNNRADAQPWTWVEWAIWHGRDGAAVAAIKAGKPLAPNLLETMARVQFAQHEITLAAAEKWAKKQPLLARGIERAQLAELAFASPALSAKTPTHKAPRL